MILEFVDKFLVHAPDKSGTERVQIVEIFLKYIGKFELPQSIESGAATSVEEQRAMEEKQKRREYNRRYYLKRKAEKAAGGQPGTKKKGGKDGQSE